MMDCRRIESLLPPYVDGVASPEDAAEVEAHLTTCTLCRAEVAAERGVRMILRARAGELFTPAPPGLRTRIAAMLRPPAASSLGWRGRLTAFAAAAAVMLMTVTAFEFVTPRSNVLFAAQLAIDHVRCFVAELGSTAPADADNLQQEFAQHYGWVVNVPPSDPEAGITLIAARRCPFWLGEYAHMLYRTGEREVSLYVTRGQERPREEHSVLGHVERIWTVKGNAYVLVARGVPAGDLDRIAAYLERESRGK